MVKLPKWHRDFKLKGNGMNAYWVMPISTNAKGDEIRIVCREGVSRTLYYTSLWMGGVHQGCGHVCDEDGVHDSIHWLLNEYKTR